MFGEDKRQAHREQNFFVNRVAVLLFLGLLVMLFLVLRVSFLTVGRGRELYELSKDNIIRTEKIPAPRGAILDRYGRLLATSSIRYNLSISPFNTSRSEIEKTLWAVARFRPDADIPTVENVMAVRPRWEQVLLEKELTPEQALPLLERLSFLPGLRVEETFVRVYPYGREAAFLTGYVGELQQRELQWYLAQGYDRNDIVGKAALEKRYESFLRGKKGSQLVWRSARGRVIDSVVEENGYAQPGARLMLTIDLDLQSTATALLQGQSGAIVAVDPRNGEVLALASSPNFDANVPQRASLDGNSEYNKAIRMHTAPGSTFKLITATAWLLAGGDPEREIFCGGYITVGNRRMHCDARYGHGKLTMRPAIERSCNLYFYQLARDLGLTRMAEAAYMFGFGRPSGIGLPGETRGRLRTHTNNLGELIMMGIGQGALISASPIQVAMAYSALANGGTLYKPLLLLRVVPPRGDPITYPPLPRGTIPWKTWQREALMRGFRDVTETNRGTGRHAGFDPEMQVAGKTSSAERKIMRDGKVVNITDAGFVCFAPWNNPEICVYVLLQDSGHGGEYAAPVAKTFLDYYYKLKEQREIEGPPVPDPARDVLPLPPV